MRTNQMIYQAATAHQTELRRIASERTLKADRNNGPTAWTRLVALVTSQQREASTAKPARTDLAISV